MASRQNFRFLWHQLQRAVGQNWSEYQCWRKTHATYLAPTYFSLGILNVGGVRQGEEPSLKEWLAVLHTLPDEAQTYLGWVDPHTFNTDNIRRTTTGYCWIDYGCTGDPEARSISHFLVTWQSALEEKLQLTDLNNTS